MEIFQKGNLHGRFTLPTVSLSSYPSFISPALTTFFCDLFQRIWSKRQKKEVMTTLDLTKKTNNFVKPWTLVMNSTRMFRLWANRT